MLRLSTAGLAVLLVAAGCAQGAIAPADYEATDGSLPEGGGLYSPDAGGGVAMSGSGLAEDNAEPCNMGDVEACTCTDGGTGTRQCYFDARSPTSGFFSECMDCVIPEPDAGTKDAGASMPDSGGAGDVPTGGTMMTGGAGATGGTMMTGGTMAPPPPPPPPPPPTKSCPGLCLDLGACSALGPFPCCNTNTGACGCTWAPGAYCF